MKSLKSFSFLSLLAVSAHHALAGEDVIPPETNVVNVVTEYGADPADRGDDTDAIQRAITENIHKRAFLYFPKGVYNVSRSLEWRRPDGAWDTILTIQGESRDGTIFKLKDGVFTDRTKPQGVIVTASQNPNSPSGSGNQAFMNNLRNFTVDTGRDNPGAMGISYLSNNAGQIVNVTIRSGDPDKVGVSGLSMTRSWPGPSLIQNVTIEGFEVGVDINHYEYSVTLENITLSGQSVAGIRNKQNVVNIHNLVSDNKVPAYLGEDENAFLALLKGELRGGDSKNAAIDIKGSFIVRNVTTSGYGEAIQSRTGKQERFPGGTIKQALSHPALSLPQPNIPPLNLAVEATPSYNSPANDWVVVDDSAEDDTEAFREAIAKANRERKGTIALKTGSRYKISETVVVSGGIRRIAGLMAELAVSGDLLRSTDINEPVFRFENLTGPFIQVDEMTLLPFAQDNKGIRFTWFEHATTVPLVVNNITSFIGSAYRNTVEGGKVFMQDVAMPGWFLKNQQAWGRQVNPEFYTRPLIQNVGSKGQLWILGLKTEGGFTLVETKDGANTEIFGGIIYPIDDPGEDPCFLIENASASLSFSETGKVQFRNMIEVRQGSKTETLTKAEAREEGLMRGGKAVPLFTTAP